MIPVGIVVLAAIVVLVLLLTGVIGNRGGSGGGGGSSASTSTRNTSRNDEDDEGTEESTRSPSSSGPSVTGATTPSAPAPAPASPTHSGGLIPGATTSPEPASPEGTPVPAGSLTGRGGSVRVEGETQFRFTPDRSGLWRFETSDNGDSDPVLTLYDSLGDFISGDDDGGSGSNSLIITMLQAGSEYIISAEFWGSGDGSYTLTVSPMDAETIPGGGGSMRVDDQTLFIFSPGQSGVWEFYTSDNGSSDPVLYLYGANGSTLAENDDGMGDRNSFISYYLEAGRSYAVSAKFYGSGSGAYTLTVSRAELIPRSGGSASMSRSSAFEFTPDRTGEWEFSVNDTGGVYPMLYLITEEYRWLFAGYYNDQGVVDTAIVNAGATYIILILFSDPDGDCSLSVTLLNEIQIQQPGSQLPDGGGSFVVHAPSEFTFTPNRTGIWTIYTTDNPDCDPYLLLYDSRGTEIAYNDDGGVGTNALIVIGLDRSETYVICAECYGGASGMYVLHVEEPPELPAAGGSVRVDGATTFTFTPGQSGTWVFETTNCGESDPYLELYDADGRFVFSDDDGGEGYNSLMAVPLNAGETYSLQVYFYNRSETHCTLNVTRG